MPTEQRLDPRQDRAMLWANRENVQKHALSRSMPWLAFVNIAFALMVIFRNVLFTEFDHQSLTHQDIIPYLEMALGAIIVFSLALCMMVISGRILSGIYATKVISAILLILSLCWSVSSYCFIILWSLPFAWPLLVILMTTGLAALYYFPVGLVAYLVPLWGISLLAGVQIHHGVDLRFLILWGICTAIMIYGRQILQRWYDEAWKTHQENMQLINRLENMANQDALTATANRRALDNFLAQAWERKEPLALIILDVDFFKRYNDHYGHQAGDYCLSCIASVLKMSVRAQEDMVARYGGEEFVIVLPLQSLDSATAVAQRIQQKIREAALPHAKSDAGPLVTVSMGIVASDGRVPASELIAQADAALYKAKKEGRNRWSY